MITVDVIDNTQCNGSVSIAGHGIPGSTAPGAPPQSLNVLGADGSFVQAAAAIAAASCAGGTATITTSVANQIQQNQTVFISGVGVAGFNGVFTVTNVTSSTTFDYELSGVSGSATGGAVYLQELISSQTITAASAAGNIVTLTLGSAVNVPVNSPIFISGLSGVGSIWNGISAVVQNPSTNPALSSDQFQILIDNASGQAGVSSISTVQIVSLNPISLPDLPVNPNTGNPSISLTEGAARLSAQFVVIVTPDGQTPFPFGITPETTNLSNLATPPFAAGQQAGNSIADIVEFYYAGSVGNSTFDVSQVDGFALPLTLQCSQVTSGPSQIGVNPTLTGFSRDLIGQAFNTFIGQEPNDVQTVGQFGRLFYNGPVETGSFAIAAASQPGTSLTNVQLAPSTSGSAVILATATTAHGLVPGQTITVAGAGLVYNGTFTVINTGLNDGSLTAEQFTFALSGSPSTSSSGQVTPTNSGAIATSAATLMVEAASGAATPFATGTTVQLSGMSNSAFDGQYTVLAIPAIAGLTSSSVNLAATGETFTPGQSSGGGTLGTPVFAQPPSVPGNQFYVIAAPKDWLANQPLATAESDPMVGWWDSTIDAFFATGNYLQVAVGTESYTGLYNASTAEFDFYSGLIVTDTPNFSIAKPVPSGTQSQSFANAAWVWAQAGIPSNYIGTVWDQIVQAFCRGVAMDGVSTSTPASPGTSNTAWTDTSNWYTEHSTANFPDFTSRYCPFAKFLHYGTLDGGTDRTGASSIYLQTLAYAFSEDETPLGTGGSAISTATPPKMDGTVPDGAAMTLTIACFPSAPSPVPAEAYAVMEAGVVLEVIVGNSGAGYTSPPTITITPPGNGMQATAFATIANGQVTGITMTSQGSGYDFSPQVTLSPEPPAGS